MKKSVRITDVIFFVSIFIVMAILIISVTFGFKLPNWFRFWWVILLPIPVILFVFPNSKLAKWLDKKRW